MIRSVRKPSSLLIILFTVSCGIGGSSESPIAQRESVEIKPGFNLLQPEQDVEIGKASLAEIRKKLPILDDGPAASYVSELGQQLAAKAPGHRFPYEFRVVDASDLNAFALPGGPIFINRGVLESAKSEGEVAGVLAHEIAHVALRHGTHNVSKAYLTRAGVGILGGLLGRDVSAGTGAIINVLGGFGLNALFLKHSRTAETQADILGARILAASGYDPREMIGFFRTLQETDKRKTVGWLSDHPTPARRIERLEEEAAALGAPTGPRRDSGNLAAVQKRLGRLPAAKSFEQLAAVRIPTPVAEERTVPVTAVAKPSHEVKTYRSPEGGFEVDHPANWMVLDADGGGVTFAPEGGAVVINDSVEIVYGAIVNHYEPFSEEAEERRMKAGAVPIAEATRDLITQLQRTSSHLQVVSERPTSTTTMISTLRGVSPNSNIEEEVRLFTTELGDGHLMFLIFVTPLKDAATYNATFDAMVLSLRAGKH